MTSRSRASGVRRLSAELKVLEWFDELRQAKGHDYGGGQRSMELSRRRNEIVRLTAHIRALGEDAGPIVTPDELAEAYGRVGRPRRLRAEREIAPVETQFGTFERVTPSKRRTVDAWRQTERHFLTAERVVDVLGG